MDEEPSQTDPDQQGAGAEIGKPADDPSEDRTFGISPRRVIRDSVDGPVLSEEQQNRYGEVTVIEAARRGGRSVRDTYGKEFYRLIGQKGGMALSEQRDSIYYQQLGKQGGQALVKKYGPAHLREIGERGGRVTKEKKGAAFYREIGKLRGPATRRTTSSREDVLRAAFEQLACEDPPATPPKMAAKTGFPLASVHTILDRVSWWGTEERQSARAAHYQRLHAITHQLGHPGIQAMRQHPSTHGRRLTVEEAQEIRRLLQQGNTPTLIAQQLGIHKNTVFSYKNGRTLRAERQTREDGSNEGEKLVQVAYNAGTTVQVFIGQALFLALGNPSFVTLTRQGLRHTLVLEPAIAGQGYQVDQMQDIPSITVECQVFQSFKLPQGQYVWAKVPHQAKARLSDYPPALAGSMMTLSEAKEQLNVSRQCISQWIARGKLHAHYDAPRNQLVCHRSEVLWRYNELAKAIKPRL